MVAEEARVYLALAYLEATAGDVSASNCLEPLNGILFTIIVKSIVDFVEEVEQVLPVVLLADFVVFAKLDDDDSDLTL